jgi:16S rRNA (cytidine1402-2'-O)-methyltransferase
MLYVVATPIGNLGDLTERARETLRSADGIACEDTRRTRALLSHLGIPCPRFLISYRQGNEDAAGRKVLPFLEGGGSLALCSDGGYPGISDPGYRLIRAAIERGLDVCVIPGASAIPVALLASGLPTSSFVFKGYPPRKPGALRRFFAEEADRPHTLVLFESPMRVAPTLQAALECLGDRQAAVCVELTKRFERVLRGFLADLAAQWSRGAVRGEVTIVIAGNHPKFSRQPAAGPSECARGGAVQPASMEPCPTALR